MRKRLTKMTLEQKAPTGGRVEVRDTDEFPRMIQADAETWGSYLEGVAQMGRGPHAPDDTASPQDTTRAANNNGSLSAATP